jgi:hypothetical protein
MKVGDLVKSIYGHERHPNRRKRHKAESLGIIVDVDPLRQPLHDTCHAVNEIVVMLDNGVIWHANPDAWEVVNESR